MAVEVSPYCPHLKLVIICIATSQFGPAQQSGAVCATKRRQAPVHFAAAAVKLAGFSCIDG